jgi:hypothetical protein
VGLLALGYVLLCLRGWIPDTLSIVIANAAFPLGMVFHLDGMRRFLDLPPVSPIWYALPVGVLVAFSILYFAFDIPYWRSAISAAATSAPHWPMARLLLRRTDRSRSVFYTVICLLLACGGTLLLVRAIWSLLILQFQLLSDTPFQLFFFVSMIVLQVGETLSFIMLNSERLESELFETETVLRRTVSDLQQALADVKALSGMLPMCAHCKKIRDDRGYWQAVEEYIQQHSEAQFSHGICPDCLKEFYPEFAESILEEKSRKG